jgi:hypothetical protein
MIAITLFIGLFLLSAGAILGFLCFALCHAASEADRRIERMRK